MATKEVRSRANGMCLYVNQSQRPLYKKTRGGHKLADISESG